MNELLTTYSMPDIVPVILIAIITLMMALWPECKHTNTDPLADYLQSRRQLDAATRDTIRRMREAASDPNDGDEWRL